MQRAPHGPSADVSGAAPELTPFQGHLLRRLDHLLMHVVPTAREAWQIELAAHAIRHTLRDCNQAGLSNLATDRLREAGRQFAHVRGAADVSETPHSSGTRSH